MDNADQCGFDEFRWADTFVTDDEQAKAFYGAVFRWSSYTEQMDNGMRYSQMLTSAADGNAKPVAGIGIKWSDDPEHCPNIWYCHLLVRNVEQSIEKVLQAGGSAPTGIMDIMDLGRLATCRDDCGQVFCLWEPLIFAGAQAMKTNGALTWFELITKETTSAVQFYQATLGWTTKECELASGRYWVFELEGQPVAGMHGDLAQSGGIAQWMPYFQVAELESTTEKCTAMNGNLVYGPEVEPSVGSFAILSDDQHNLFGIAHYESEFERKRTS